MTAPSASPTPTLTPLDVATYFRDHAPKAAKCGMRGYILRLLLDMIRFKGAEAGQCFPSVATLADQAGRSVRHIRRILAELEALGVIRRVIRRREDGGYGSNIYRLTGLLEWAVKNVRGVSDMDGRKTSFRKNKNPRGGGSMFFKGKNAQKDRGNAPSAAPMSNARKDSAASQDGSTRPWRALMTGQLDFNLMEAPSSALDAGMKEAAKRGMRALEAKAFALWRWRETQNNA